MILFKRLCNQLLFCSTRCTQNQYFHVLSFCTLKSTKYLMLISPNPRIIFRKSQILEDGFSQMHLIKSALRFYALTFELWKITFSLVFSLICHLSDIKYFLIIVALRQ